MRLVLPAVVMRSAPLREDGEGVDESVGFRFELSVDDAAAFGVVAAAIVAVAVVLDWVIAN